MPGASKFVVKVTAGPSYDTATHSVVQVNGSEPAVTSNEHADARIFIRMQDYKGLPKGSPESCAYFSHPEHAHDRYSIGFRFIPKKAISGEDLRFGNDFDKPIRDHLPPGFSSAFWIVKHVLDPGLDGDVRADKPHLYGPVLSSVDAIRIADKKADFADVPHDDAGVEVEGADGDALQLRADLGIPDDPKRRRKFFLDTSHRQNFTFEAGRLYRCDFFNPYLDFNDFSLKLPGFTLNILPYWDGQPLRYVLKDVSSDAVLFVVLFDLIPLEDAAAQATSAATNTGDSKAPLAQAEADDETKFQDEGVD